MQKQRTRSDCAICCISEATGLPYEKVVKMAGDLYDPFMGFFTSEEAFARCGLQVVRVKAMERGRPAFVTTTLKIVGGIRMGHMFYWNGEELLDPAQNPVSYEEIYAVWQL